MVDMLEHETSLNLTALGARGTLDVFTAFATDRDFLIKKMEVNVNISGGIENNTSPAAPTQTQGILVFFHDSGNAAGSIATALDAGLQNQELHNDVIWIIPWQVQPVVVDADSFFAYGGSGFAAMRTKSFPKGYPLKDSQTYVWALFNPRSSAWILPAQTAGNCWLRVRYWGVYF